MTRIIHARTHSLTSTGKYNTIHDARSRPLLLRRRLLEHLLLLLVVALSRSRLVLLRLAGAPLAIAIDRVSSCSAALARPPPGPERQPRPPRRRPRACAAALGAFVASSTESPSGIPIIAETRPDRCGCWCTTTAAKPAARSCVSCLYAMKAVANLEWTCSRLARRVNKICLSSSLEAAVAAALDEDGCISFPVVAALPPPPPSSAPPPPSSASGRALAGAAATANISLWCVMAAADDDEEEEGAAAAEEEGAAASGCAPCGCARLMSRAALARPA